MDVTNREHFRTIRNAIENNKLVVFVGAGASVDSGFPLWGDLISEFKESLDIARTDDYLKIAEHYYLQYGQNTYYRKVSEFIPQDKQPNEIHKLLLQLKPQHIITTNWDNLLEKAVGESGDLYFTVANDHELAASPSSQLLVKMHGDVNHRNIVFKESDYFSYTDNFPLIENFIKSLFSTHVVLFLGYSISDYNLNQILSWVRHRTKEAPPSFTVLTDTKITLSEANYLKEKGVFSILTNYQEADLDEFSSLSPHGSKVAKVLKSIVSPEEKEKIDIVSEIVKDVANWVVVYPLMLVRLYRDRVNVADSGKVYYDSDFNVINYHLDDSEKEYTRARYRLFRHELLKILEFVPVNEIRLHFTFGKYLKIKGKNDFNFIDDYTSYDYKEIVNRVASIKSSSFENPDKHFQYAIDNYYVRNIEEAHESFKRLTHSFFIKSSFIKSLICAFNQKHLLSGPVPIGNFENIFVLFEKEELSLNDCVSNIIDKFPNSLVNRQKALFQNLDSNNSFLLERFKAITVLSRKIDKEIDKINRGSLVRSNNWQSLYYQILNTTLYLTKNKIALTYSPDYKELSNIAFEAIFRRQSIGKQIYFDSMLSYLCISSYDESEQLANFLDLHLKEKELRIDEETTEYILEMSQNILDTISISYSEDLSDFCLKKWSNVFTLLSFISHNETILRRILDSINQSFDSPKWLNLSVAANHFLAIQYNKYGTNFPIDALLDLFNKQMEKIASYKTIPYHADGKLLQSLIRLIKNNSDKEIKLFTDDNVEVFLHKIKAMSLEQKHKAITTFLFTIYTLATENLKQNIESLFTDTYHEFKKIGFNESSIIYALNLYSLKVLPLDEMDSILNDLDVLVADSLAKKSSSGYFTTIKEQLSWVDGELLQGRSELIKNVELLSESFENGFRKMFS